MGEILPSNIDKCLQKYDLVIGTAIYVTVEIYLWAILSLTAIYNEFRMIERFNSANDSAFSEFAVNSSYYVILFGQQRSEGRTGVISEFTTEKFNETGKIGKSDFLSHSLLEMKKKMRNP